jgi:hypothetical protein
MECAGGVHAALHPCSIANRRRRRYHADLRAGSLRSRLLFVGRELAALHAGGLALHAGDLALHAGDLALHAGDRALRTGGLLSRLLFVGRELADLCAAWHYGALLFAGIVSRPTGDLWI